MLNKNIKVISLSLTMGSMIVYTMSSPTMVLADSNFIPPDSGVIQQSTQKILYPILPDRKINLTRPAPDLNQDTQSGVKIKISEITFVGNTTFSAQQLLEKVIQHVNQEHNFVSLKNIATSITRHYRENGYLLTTAYIAEQNISDGKLEITVLEGFIGEFNVTANGRISEKKVESYFDGLQGKPLKSDVLERQLRLLTDRNVGVKVTFKPAQQQGAALLDIAAEEYPLFRGRMSVDNKGNRYTNTTRSAGIVEINNPTGYGDRHIVSLVTGGENYSYFSLDSDLPIGYNGLTVKFGVSDMDYKLGKEFESLSARGDNRQYNIGLYYPWQRSLNKNLYSNASFRWSKSTDFTLDIQSNEQVIKTFEVLTYGDFRQRNQRFHWNLENTFGKANDRIQEDAESGDFTKISAGLNHDFYISPQLVLTSSVDFQYTNDNLVSAQKFALSGAQGVRAYPQGEGLVDKGALSSFELSYSILPRMTVSGFFDIGIGQEKVASSVLDVNNHKKLSGLGASFRYLHKDLGVFDVTAAWRTESEASTSRDKTPRFWLEWSKSFGR